MAQTKKADFQAQLQIKAVELLNGYIKHPGVQELSIANFSFSINLESKADNSTKLIFVIVNVEIKSEDQNYLLGSLAISCVYSIVNYDDIIKKDSSGTIEIPQNLVDILNSISISTMRGVMFSTFKGTFLHNAFLPIIDPKSLQPLEKPS